MTFREDKRIAKQCQGKTIIAWPTNTIGNLEPFYE